VKQPGTRRMRPAHQRRVDAALSVGTARTARLSAPTRRYPTITYPSPTRALPRPSGTTAQPGPLPHAPAQAAPFVACHEHAWHKALRVVPCCWQATLTAPARHCATFPPRLSNTNVCWRKSHLAGETTEGHNPERNFRVQPVRTLWPSRPRRDLTDLTLWGPGVRPDPLPCSAR
jgi:hypothetical protein